MIAKQAPVIHSLRKEGLKSFHQSLFVETEEDFVTVWLLLRGHKEARRRLCARHPRLPGRAPGKGWSCVAVCLEWKAVTQGEGPG